MAPRKQYVYAITRRAFDSEDKTGEFSIVDIHANVKSANEAADEQVGDDDEDDIVESKGPDGCKTFQNNTVGFTIQTVKMELKDGGAAAKGGGAASAASAVSSTAKTSTTKKAAAKKPAAANKKTTMLQGEPDSLQGIKIMFTGTLSMDRKTCEATAQAHGAEIVPAAKMEESDYIVLGNKPGQKKLDDIANKGLNTLTEAEFIEMLNEPASKKRKA